MNRTKGSISAVAGFCLLWTLILFITAVTVVNIAGDRVLLSGEMYRYAWPSATGLPDEEYPEMGRMIAEYLTGRRDEFQYTYRDKNDKEISCFQPHEAAHMADCRGLIRTAGTLRWILLAAALVFFGIGIAIREHRKQFLSGIISGAAVAGVVFISLLLWGLIDFDSLFTLFHRVMFTNEGWMLNPKTDMLIRLMPTPFFTSMGVRVLLAVAAMGLAAFSAAVTIRMSMRKSEMEARYAEKAAHNA
jgi:integral membrane protein (TIGR01906 family)